MSLPYATATSGQKALEDIQSVLRHFGCSQFGSMMDFERGELLVQFTHQKRTIVVKASFAGYAAAWLRQNPYSSRRRCSKVEHERTAKEVASVAVYSVLRDWIKGQVTAIETGILSFEGAFLGQILLPNGQTVLEMATEKQLLIPGPNGDSK